MPRVPPELLERVKQEISIARLVERAGVALKKVGDNLVGLCPMHDYHEPSLVISADRNVWHCLGACQAGGSVVDWVMRKDRLSFRQAIDVLLAEFFPLGSRSLVEGAPKRSGMPQLSSALDLGADEKELARQVIGYYHETLKESPEALAYPEDRGLKNAKMINRFQLGYANRTLGYRLPEMSRAAGKAIRTAVPEGPGLSPRQRTRADERIGRHPDPRRGRRGPRRVRKEDAKRPA